jgi:hypothetical protein
MPGRTAMLDALAARGVSQRTRLWGITVCSGANRLPRRSCSETSAQQPASRPISWPRSSSARPSRSSCSPDSVFASRAVSRYAARQPAALPALSTRPRASPSADAVADAPRRALRRQRRRARPPVLLGRSAPLAGPHRGRPRWRIQGASTVPASLAAPE